MSTKNQLGKYRLLAELGHGGMADVFLTIVEGPAGLGFAKLAVIKRLRANLADDPEFVTMLIDEARITARLNHPNVVQMLEVGHVGEEYFLAMEYLDGQPLHRIERRVVRAGGVLSKEAQMAVLLDVLAGLHHAHELNDYDGTPLDVIHRDVTPHNIFVTYDGQVKVMDFGIAKAVGRAQHTKHGIIKGKTRFMAPEQAYGGRVDRRVDIFAVGILLWQAATGKRFWGELDELEIVERLIGGRYEVSPRAISPEVPEELDRICRRAIAHRVEDRYATAHEMREDLEAFVGAESLRGHRQLVRLLTEHFAKERTQIRGIVEKAAQNCLPVMPRSQTSGSGSVSGVAHTLPLGGPSSSAPPPASVVTPPVSVAPTATSAASLRSTFVSSLVAAVLAVLGASMVTNLTTASNHANSAATRPKAVVASDFTRLAEDVPRARTRVEAEVGRPALLPGRATPPSPRSASREAPPEVVTPIVTPRPSTRTRSGHVEVDSTDPWTPN